MDDKEKRHIPCQCCVNDWIDLQPEIPEYIGTVVYPECDDVKHDAIYHLESLRRENEQIKQYHN